MWVHGVGLNGLHAFYAHPAANQNQSTRVSVSVSARGGRQGGRSKESFSQFVEILELFKLQDAATDALLHRVPLPDSSGARPLCQERPQVHLQLPHRTLVVPRPQNSQVPDHENKTLNGNNSQQSPSMTKLVPLCPGMLPRDSNTTK